MRSLTDKLFCRFDVSMTLDLIFCIISGQPDHIPEYADRVSYCAFNKLLTCQAHELFMQASQHFNLLGPPVNPPPWIRY